MARWLNPRTFVLAGGVHAGRSTVHDFAVAGDRETGRAAGGLEARYGHGSRWHGYARVAHLLLFFLKK